MDNIIYERNMKALKERYEGLAYIIENKKYKDDREDQIEESFTTRNRKIRRYKLYGSYIYCRIREWFIYKRTS